MSVCPSGCYTTVYAAKLLFLSVAVHSTGCSVTEIKIANEHINTVRFVLRLHDILNYQTDFYIVHNHALSPSDVVTKLTNAYKRLRVSYKHSVPPASYICALVQKPQVAETCSRHTIFII